jgi:hypothetical protein
VVDVADKLIAYLLPIASGDDFFSSPAYLDQPADLVDALTILRNGTIAYYERRGKRGKN